MAGTKPHRIKTISEFHQTRGLSKPEHPLISLVDYATVRHSPEFNGVNWTLDFYMISIKRG
jgi:AraC family transcriptional activator of pobA